MPAPGHGRVVRPTQQISSVERGKCGWVHGPSCASMRHRSSSSARAASLRTNGSSGCSRWPPPARRSVANILASRDWFDTLLEDRCAIGAQSMQVVQRAAAARAASWRRRRAPELGREVGPTADRRFTTGRDASRRKRSLPQPEVRVRSRQCEAGMMRGLCQRVPLLPQVQRPTPQISA